jgi:hypothetical protein
MPCPPHVPHAILDPVFAGLRLEHFGQAMARADALASPVDGSQEKRPRRGDLAAGDPDAGRVFCVEPSSFPLAYLVFATGV